VSEFLVVTGLSGAGRSLAADHLEDLGWTVIDNLPTPLVPAMADLAGAPGSDLERVALVIGSGHHADVMGAVEHLRQRGAVVRVLFLDAPTPELIRRYEATRRRHPLGGAGLLDAIERERELLGPVREAADVCIDTGGLNVHQLGRRVVELFTPDGDPSRLTVRLVSFGYRNGIPADADMVIDCRFLPNPHWLDDLRPLTGLDEPVNRYVLEQPATEDFLRRLEGLLDLVVPAMRAEGRSYLSLALGCTGGRHRSVVLVAHLAEWLRETGMEPLVHHRDL
jgi:UPF0042 nucleotide-binding protein